MIACSAYKWFGPHICVLCASPALLEEFRPDKLKPSPDEAPDRWELGTLPFESLAGVRAAAEYMLELDFDAVRAHEEGLMARVLDGLRSMDHVTLYGDAADRAPTLMFTVAGMHPDDVARALAAKRDRRVERQLLRVGARAGARAGSARRHPGRVPALQRRLGRRAAARGGCRARLARSPRVIEQRNAGIDGRAERRDPRQAYATTSTRSEVVREITPACATVVPVVPAVTGRPRNELSTTRSHARSGSTRRSPMNTRAEAVTGTRVGARSAATRARSPRATSSPSPPRRDSGPA